MIMTQTLFPNSGAVSQEGTAGSDQSWSEEQEDCIEAQGGQTPY
jgi:hypothetical protein